MKHCTKAWLVSLEYPIPTDPSAAYQGPPIFGCNHLVCQRCGAEVRHVDHRSVGSMHPPDDLAALYASAHPETSPHLEGGSLHDTSRAYLCKCAWYGMNFSGAKQVDDLEYQDWICGGHDPSAKKPKGPTSAVVALSNAEATLKAKAEAVTAEASRRYVDVAGAKIQLHWAPGVNPAFSTAAGLRDALLASYPDAAQFGGPIVGRNREDTAPAWGWAAELIAQRSDWWPALGIALQHAAKDGGELAQIALATLLADYRDSFALLPWMAPLAEAETFHVRAPGSATGWGMPDCTIPAIVHDQQTSFAEIHGAKEQFLYQYGKNATNLKGPFTKEADLRALLEKSARAGQFPYGTRGPWSWVGPTLIVGEPWLRPALVHAISTIDADDEVLVLALLDWLSEERDLWQFVPLLDSWDAHHPAWWDQPAGTQPSGWKYNARSSHWPDVHTMGDIVVEANRRAKLQIATPPVVDLPALYGPSIS